MLPKGGLLLVKSASGEPVACAAYRPLEGTTCELKRFFIRPDLRGQGIADLLLEKILLQARKAGYEEAKLDTLERLVPARRFYERNGFALCDPYYPNPEPDVLYFSRRMVPNAPEALWPYINLQGKLTAMPSGKGSADTYQLALDYLLEIFEVDREYTEREVNEALRLRHTFNDPALLRRELVDRGSLQRDSTGRAYTRVG
jgi:predicted GNAT family acetyltransferase